METKKILIIEDDWHFRVLLETSLMETGHGVRCAENGKAGIVAAASWHPDLVIMDLEMPVMDGIPTIYVLREKGYKGKIAVLSGNLSKENRDKAGEAGANHFFSKPFQDDPKRMVEMIFSQAGSTPATSLENWTLHQPAPDSLEGKDPNREYRPISPSKTQTLRNVAPKHYPQQGTSAPKHIQDAEGYSNRHPHSQNGYVHDTDCHHCLDCCRQLVVRNSVNLSGV